MMFPDRRKWSYLAVVGALAAAESPVAHAQAVRAGATRTGATRTSVARTSVRASNVNVNRNVNVYSTSVSYDRWGHPVARAAAATATAVAVGTMVASLPPSCTTVLVGGATYHSCGGAYYQPVYQGSGVEYVVVNAPQ
jgi:Family of unknown function (DUF6515)